MAEHGKGEKQMYFNFTVIDVGDAKLPNPNDIHFSKEILENYYYIIVEDYQELFVQKEIDSKNKKLYWYPKFFEGWKNLPLVYFDEEAYNKDELCLLSFNPYCSEGIKGGVRRKKIDKTLSSKLTMQVEIKKLRKVVGVILNAMPELSITPAIEDFQKYSSFVQEEINKNPKEKVVEIDLYKENGIGE